MSAGATIYDVAERAGVSISTVSLALNSPARVKPATLERVMEAIDELRFVPKTEAVTRARRGVGRIGVIAPFTSFASFARRLNGVLQAVRGEPFEVVVFDQESAATSRLVTLPLTRRIDGLIVMSIPVSDEIAERLIAQGVETVLVELDHPRFTSVMVDNRAGGRMVAELLVQRGHRQIGFIGHSQRVYDYVSPSEARLQGLREGLGDAGLGLADGDISLVQHSLAAAHAGAVDLLAREDRPTAVFAYDDHLASGVLTAARELGLAVPGDLAVVGFDDGDLAEPLGLTSVSQPLEESGQVAVEAMLARLTNRNQTVRHTSLRLSLVERATT